MSYMGIFTTKGGVGKTTIALNLAVVMANYGSSALVEFDTNYTLSAILKFEATKVVDLMKEHKKITRKFGIGIVTSDSRTAQVERKPDPAGISNLISALAGFDFVVFDFHNSASPLVVALLQKSDIIIVPAIPTIAGLGAYIHTRKILEKLNLNHLGVINMVPRSIFGVPREVREIIKKLRDRGSFWSGMIPYDRSVVKAELVHKPAVAEFPNSHFSRSIKDLAKEVMNYAHNRY